MNAGSTTTIRNDRIRTYRRRAVVGVATTAAGVATMVAGGGSSQAGAPFGPIPFLNECSFWHTPFADPGANFETNHEPGEVHRYQWILRIDGKEVLGGTTQAKDDRTVRIPELYPIVIGGQYELAVADRTASPDRIAKATTTMADCGADTTRGRSESGWQTDRVTPPGGR